MAKIDPAARSAIEKTLTAAENRGEDENYITTREESEILNTDIGNQDFWRNVIGAINTVDGENGTHISLEEMQDIIADIHEGSNDEEVLAKKYAVLNRFAREANLSDIFTDEVFLTAAQWNKYADTMFRKFPGELGSIELARDRLTRKTITEANDYLANPDMKKAYRRLKELGCTLVNSSVATAIGKYTDLKERFYSIPKTPQFTRLFQRLAPWQIDTILGDYGKNGVGKALLEDDGFREFVINRLDRRSDWLEGVNLKDPKEYEDPAFRKHFFLSLPKLKRMLKQYQNQ